MFYINRDIKSKSTLRSKIENLIEKISTQNTWCYSDKKIYFKVKELYQKIYDNDNHITKLNEKELNSIWKKIEHYDELIKTNFNNCFITTKRKNDGTYIDDVITSKKECIEWIENNKKYISKIDLYKVNEFWDKYPNGVIDFG